MNKSHQSITLDESSKTKLKKLIIDKLSSKLRLIIIILTILTILTIRIILFFTTPPHFKPLPSVLGCPLDFSTTKELCQDINIHLQKKWVGKINNFSEKDQFIVIQGRIIRDFESSGRREKFDVKFKTRFLSSSGEVIREESGQEYFHFHRSDIVSVPRDFFFVNDVASGDYEVEIVLDLEDVEVKFLQGFNFQVFVGDYENLKMVLGVRYAFFALSVLMFGFYLVNFVKVAKDFRTFEHNFVFVLSFSLVFFNDPFIALILNNPTSKFWSVVSVFFIVQFVVLLFYFILIIAKRYEKLEKNVFTKVAGLKEKIGMGVIFIFLLVTAAIYNTDQNMHPAYFKENDSIFFLVLVIITAILVFSFWIICLFLICKAISRFKNLLVRQQFLLIVSLIVLIFVVLNLITGFYHHFSLYPGRTIVYFISLNIYVFALQILWRFTGGEILVEKIDPKHKKVEIKVTFEEDDNKTDFPDVNNDYGNLKFGKQDLQDNKYLNNNSSYNKDDTIDYEKEKEKKNVYLKNNMENVNLKPSKKIRESQIKKDPSDEDDEDKDAVKKFNLERRQTYEFND